MSVRTARRPSTVSSKACPSRSTSNYLRSCCRPSLRAQVRWISALRNSLGVLISSRVALSCASYSAGTASLTKATSTAQKPLEALSTYGCARS